MRAARLGPSGEFCHSRDRHGYQASAAAHDLRREGSRLVTKAQKPKRSGAALGNPSAAFSFSGAQTGVAPGVTVDHACSAPSRFDSERAHDMMDERKHDYALDVLGS